MMTSPSKPAAAVAGGLQNSSAPKSVKEPTRNSPDASSPYANAALAGPSSATNDDSLSSNGEGLASLVDSSDDVAVLLNEMIASTMSASPAAPEVVAINGQNATGSSSSSASVSLLSLDRNLSDLLGRLSVLGQDCSTSLDRSMRDVGTRVMPRLTWDLQYMRESAEGVRESLKGVERRTREEDLSAVKVGAEDEAMLLENDLLEEDDANAAASAPDVLRRLVRLDKLKTRLVAARDVLREAESWSTLESETGAYLAAGDWRRSSARLSEAARSLRVFRKASKEYDERKRLLVGLQGELQQRLGQVLRERLSQTTQPEPLADERPGDDEDAPQQAVSLKEIHGVFASMDRSDDFKDIYFQCRREPLLSTWAEGAQQQSSLSASLSDTLYTPLLALLTSESQSMPDIFDRPIEALTALLHSTLESLSPSLPERLEGCFGSPKADDTEALPELIACYQVTERFAGDLQALFERMGSSLTTHSPLPSPDLPTASHSRRASRRFSRSLAGPFDPTSLAPPAPATPTSAAAPVGWDVPLYEPFLDYQSEYAALERRHLLAQHKRESSAHLEQRVAASLQRASEAIDRCRAFTHGYGIAALVEAIDASEAQLIESSQSLLVNSVAPTPSSTSTSAVDELDDLAGLGDEAQAPIRSGLAHLQSCRACDRSLQDLLSLVISAVGEGQTSAKTPGGTSLLQQSTLNSLDLSKLTSGTTPPQLARARQSLTALTAEAQKELQRTILSPIQDLLVPYPTLPVWSKSDKPARGGLQIPTFSLSPTDIISQVAESLLNLLRVFELYANDPALAYSLETLPYVDREGLRAVLEQSTDAIPSDLVVSAWVSSLAFCLLAYMTVSLLPSMRPPLTSAGAAQLATDLAYLGNAVKALDVEWEELETWRQAAEARAPPPPQEVKPGSADVWRTMAALRGWS